MTDPTNNPDAFLQEIMAVHAQRAGLAAMIVGFLMTCSDPYPIQVLEKMLPDMLEEYPLDDDIEKRMLEAIEVSKTMRENEEKKKLTPENKEVLDELIRKAGLAGLN